MTTINIILCPVQSYPLPPPAPRRHNIPLFQKTEATFSSIDYCKLKLNSKFPAIIFPTERKEGESFCVTLQLQSLFLPRKAREEEFEIYVRVNIILCVKKF